MRKIISFMHISLEGFVAGPNGEMNWIKVDEEIFPSARGLRHSQYLPTGREATYMNEEGSVVQNK